jgi:hypothetical protein
MCLGAGQADVEEPPLLGDGAGVERLVEGELALLEPGQEDGLELESLRGDGRCGDGGRANYAGSVSK